MTRHQGPHGGARLLKREGTCQLPRGWGTDHPGAGRCRKHLGSTPNGRKTAAEEQAQAQAREELVRLGVVVPCENPLLELQRQVGLTLQWRDTCAKLINRLDPDDLRFCGSLKGEQVRAEVTMLQDAMDWAGHQLVALTRLNLDDRLSVITHADAHRIEQALTAALAVLNPPAEQSLQARREFVRVLTSGIAPGETRQAIADAGLRSDGVDYAEDDGAISGVVIPAPW